MVIQNKRVNNPEASVAIATEGQNLQLKWPYTQAVP